MASRQEKRGLCKIGDSDKSHIRKHLQTLTSGSKNIHGGSHSHNSEPKASTMQKNRKTKKSFHSSKDQYNEYTAKFKTTNSNLMLEDSHHTTLGLWSNILISACG